MKFNIPSGTDKIPLTIRIDEEDFEIIDKLSKKSKKSYNYIVNAMIKFSVENMDTSEIKEIKK